MAEETIGVIRGVAVGSYGQVITATIENLDGVAQDISAFTGTKLAIARSPDREVVVKATASFVSTGTNGQLEFEWGASDIDRPGDWLIQMVLNKTGGRAKSYFGVMPVIKQLEADT
jgi:hypothetical protein